VADSLKKVQPGEKLRIPAAAYNAFIDTARDLRQRQQSQKQDDRPQQRDTGIVLVKNASGADRNRFDVLGIDNTVVTPSDNLDQFKNKVALGGVTPTESDHTGRFVILLEPLVSGAIGQAVAAGVSPAQVDVQDEDDRFADVKDGDAASLKTASSGAAAILWKESGTGVKWAVVRIGAGGGGGGDSTGEVQYTVHMMVADNVDGWDFPRAHNPP
jgi:hypothetical protein